MLVKGVTVGPLGNILDYRAFLLKAKSNYPDVILGRPALLHRLFEKRNVIEFMLREGTIVALPINSEQILAAINYAFWQASAPRQVYDIYNLTRPCSAAKEIMLFNINADFRIYSTAHIPFDGITTHVYSIFDIVKGSGPSYIPINPRFRNKEILEYHSRNDTTYAMVDSITESLITLPNAKLRVPAYRLRLSPADNTSNEDPNKVITVIDSAVRYDQPTLGDFSAVAPVPEMKKLPQATQDDLRRKRFDPFYRYGGL